MKYAISTRIIRIPASGRITPNLISYALKKGADKVLIGDCPQISLRVPWSSDVAKKNIQAVEQKLKDAGVKGKRIYFKEFGAGDLTGFVSTVNELYEEAKNQEDIPDEIKEKLCRRK